MGQESKTQENGAAAKAVIQILNSQSATRLKAREGGRNAGVLKGAEAALKNGAGMGTETASQNGAVMGASGQDSDENSFVVQYNPSSVKISESITENSCNPAEGLNIGFYTGGSCTRTVSVELVFYRQDEGSRDFVKRRIETFLAVMMRSPDRRISFNWADMTCIGSISSVSASYEMFDEEGYPVYGKVNLSIREETDGMGRQFEKAGGPERNTLRSMEKGL